MAFTRGRKVSGWGERAEKAWGRRWRRRRRREGEEVGRWCWVREVMRVRRCVVFEGGGGLEEEELFVDKGSSSSSDGGEEGEEEEAVGFGGVSGWSLDLEGGGSSRSSARMGS